MARRPSGDPEGTTPGRAAEASIGVAAVLGVVLCCVLPAILSGGVLASVGAWLGQPLVIAAGVVVLAGAVGFVVIRLRAR